MTLETIFTVHELATALKVSDRTILRAIKKGQLTATKIGKGYRISKDAVMAFWQKAQFKIPPNDDSEGIL